MTKAKDVQDKLENTLNQIKKDGIGGIIILTCDDATIIGACNQKRFSADIKASIMYGLISNIGNISDNDIMAIGKILTPYLLNEMVSNGSNDVTDALLDLFKRCK